MSRYYDKDKLKELLELEQIYDLLELWGGEPEYTENGLIARTICHNVLGEGSRKLYYYSNTRLFHCFTGCVDPSFDIFELAIKVAKLQKGIKWELYDAMCFIADYFGFAGEQQEEKGVELADWQVFSRHKLEEVKLPDKVVLPEYDPIILSRFTYPRIISWEEEGISPEVSQYHKIGYYAGGDQITIPHYDEDGRLIGIRGRYISADMAERYGKYRPLYVNKVLYNHPLSMNLYNFNLARPQIAQNHIALVFESEKACLQYASMYGRDNDISVAVCGSSVSSYHIHLLKECGAREIILCLDRQFQEIGDDEFKRLTSKLTHLYRRYNNTVKISIVFDKNMITSYKAAPTDEGREKFETLLRERIMEL